MNKHAKAQKRNEPVQLKKKLHETRIDIEEGKRADLVELINSQLADTLTLYSHTKQAHWNVKGIYFNQMHELFDMLGGTIFPYIDMLAERVTSLGGTAEGTVGMANSNTSLDEFPSGPGNGETFVAALADRYAAYAKTTRAAIARSEELDDPSTADLFTEISREMDKALWFLEAHLQEA